jgi:hypothetical protein
MLNELDSINDPTARERIERAVIKPIISTKGEIRSRRQASKFSESSLQQGENEVQPAQDRTK